MFHVDPSLLVRMTPPAPTAMNREYVLDQATSKSAVATGTEVAGDQVAASVLVTTVPASPTATYTEVLTATPWRFAVVIAVFVRSTQLSPSLLLRIVPVAPTATYSPYRAIAAKLAVEPCVTSLHGPVTEDALLRTPAPARRYEAAPEEAMLRNMFVVPESIGADQLSPVTLVTTTLLTVGAVTSSAVPTATNSPPMYSIP